MILESNNQKYFLFVSDQLFLFLQTSISHCIWTIVSLSTCKTIALGKMYLHSYDATHNSSLGASASTLFTLSGAV